MTCEECRDQLVLSERGGPVPSSAEEHLKQCLACQEFVHDSERLRKEVHLLAQTEQAPGELRERVQALFEARIPQGGARGRRFPAWAGVAATIGLLALSGYGLKRYYTQRSLTPDHLAREFISDHLNYLPGREEIVSNSPRDVEQWFQGRVDFPVRVPELPEATLSDARVCQIAGRKAALLHYRHKPDESLISFFVTVEPQSFERAGKSMEVSTSYQGLNSTLWCHRGLVFSLVAAVDEPSLDQLAESVRRQSP
jgi:anti-sigma factor RsiW